MPVSHGKEEGNDVLQVSKAVDLLGGCTTDTGGHCIKNRNEVHHIIPRRGMAL